MINNWRQSYTIFVLFLFFIAKIYFLCDAKIGYVFRRFWISAYFALLCFDENFGNKFSFKKFFQMKKKKYICTQYMMMN